MTTATTKRLIERIPDYVGMLITIGSLVFSVGYLYSDVQKMKEQVTFLSSTIARQEALSYKVSGMQEQIDRVEKGQDRLVDRLMSLDSTLIQIQVGMARIEEKLIDKNKKEK